MPLLHLMLPLSFNTCPHAGGNHGRATNSSSMRCFNTCPHAGGNRAANSRKSWNCRSFNTCPHAGGNRNQDKPRAGLRVSIHAPTRGATIVAGSSGAVVNVSIHAPTRGATRNKAKGFPALKKVSIHAPTRGATASERVHTSRSTCFNTCPHAGGNVVISASIARRKAVSIHAPTRGATMKRYRKGRLQTFQYMPPRGGQPISSTFHLRIFPVSIHAPTRGATQYRRLHGTPYRVSIHAPTRGATETMEFVLKRGMFQYMPPRGGQPSAPTPSCARTRFNTCPHAGGNRNIAVVELEVSVSIHAPTRGATNLQFSPCDPNRVSIHAPTRGATPTHRRQG